MSTEPARLALVGAPGAGKSSVARELADHLGAPVVDADAEIERLAGMSTADIFAVAGEERFRALEREANLAALAAAGAVVATSSGAITDPEIRAALARLPVLWLRIDATHSSRRSGLSALAPAIFGGMRARLIQQLAERDPLYGCVAAATIDTSQATLADVVAAARAQVDARGW